MNIKNILLLSAALGAIIFLGVFIRSSTLSLPTVLDYDPWYFYRYAEDIVQNDYKTPEWDSLTYYPPGRPVQISVGWPYTIAYLYKILNGFSSSIEMMDVGKLAPLLLVALIPIPAFLLGRLLSNNIGGLLTGLFAVTAPIFIGVSMAGYLDTDAPTVFYMFLSVFAIFLALKNSALKLKNIPYYLFAIVSTLLFVYNWEGGWFVLLLFLVFIPAFVIFRLLEEMWHQKKFRLHFKNLIPDTKAILIPLVIIFVVTNIIGYLLNFNTMFHALIGGLGFTGIAGERLIVNISVAELQTINVFSVSGLHTIAERVGFLLPVGSSSLQILPMALSLFGLPILMAYKFFKKEKISFVEIFLSIWWLVSFYLISTGIRFSLFFMISNAVSTGYVIGNLYNYLKGKNILLFASVFALISIFTFVLISGAIQIGKSGSGLAISQNWYDGLDWLKVNADKDSLISTWWDPGHIITGYTGLKAHADGAHCGGCTPYNHNVRIRDMGKIFSTSNEDESLDLLKKYTHLTEEQCETAKKSFPNVQVPDDACKDVSEVYVLATSDLIGKYYWMSCFGNFDMQLWNTTHGDKWQCDGRNYVQVPFSNFDAQGLPIYTQGGFTTTLLQNGTDLIAVVNVPSEGVRNAVVSDVVFYTETGRVHSTFPNATIDGMVWIDPSFRTIIFMDQQIRDSIFTRMFFFDGQGLSNFDLMYSNPEVKIFKAKI